MMLQTILTLFLITAILSPFLIGFIPYRKLEVLRFVSFSCSVLLFLLSLLLWVFFQETIGMFQFLVYFHQIPLFGVDGFSLIFILLTTFVFVCTFLLIWTITTHLKLLVILLLILEALLLLVFTVVDIFLFYIFFELILLPMVLIIFLWGSRSRKIKASYYFFIYTLFGSLFMLLGIVLLYYEFGTTNLLFLLYLTPIYSKQILLWLLFFFSFAIKIPMFPFHIWLPEAHVEAPTIGSVLLAGLLLKLGAYGFLRLLIPLFPEATLFFQPFVLTLACLGVIYSSLLLLRQIDLKKIIAYSSVAHMNFAIIGLFSNTLLGIQGSVYLFVSHGFSSSALFILVGILYERHHTRLIHYYGGLAQLMPIYAFFFFIFTIANFGFPATSNFIGEFLIFLGVIEKSFGLMFCSGIGMLLSVVYSILLFSRLLFGELKFYYITFQFIQDISRREFMVLFFFSLMLFFFGIKPTFFFNLLTIPSILLII